MENEPEPRSQMLTIVLQPGAELSFQQFQQAMPCFHEAWTELSATIAQDPAKGWRTVGGFHEYLLAQPGKPRVRVTYSFDDTELIVRRIDAFDGAP